MHFVSSRLSGLTAVVLAMTSAPVVSAGPWARLVEKSHMNRIVGPPHRHARHLTLLVILGLLLAVSPQVMGGSCGSVSIADPAAGTSSPELACFTYPPATPTRCICDRIAPKATSVADATVTVDPALSSIVVKGWSWGGNKATADFTGAYGAGGGSGYAEVKVSLPIDGADRTMYFHLASAIGALWSYKPTDLRNTVDHAEPNMYMYVGGGGQGGLAIPSGVPGRGGAGGGVAGVGGEATSAAGCQAGGGSGGSQSSGGGGGGYSGAACTNGVAGAPGHDSAAQPQATGGLGQYSGPGLHAGGTGATAHYWENSVAVSLLGGAGGGSSFGKDGAPIARNKLLPGFLYWPGNAGDPDRSIPNPLLSGSPAQTPDYGMGFGFLPPAREPSPGRIVFVWGNPAAKGDIGGGAPCGNGTCADGNADLIIRNSLTWEHKIWFMNGGATRIGESALPTPSSTALKLSGADDFNADGKQDLVFWNSSTGAIEFWLMNGATRDSVVQMPAPPLPPDPSWRLSATADFNYDGKPDLVWRNLSTQKISIWTMNGTTYQGQVIPTPDQAVDANWEIVGAVDVDNNGSTDFLWYNWSSGKIVQWLMDFGAVRTTGRFTSPANAGDANWKVLAVGNYGLGSGGVQDSNDMVWRNTNSGKFVVWYMGFDGVRTDGGFTTPDAPDYQPSSQPWDWEIVGPR